MKPNDFYQNNKQTKKINEVKKNDICFQSITIKQRPHLSIFFSDKMILPWHFEFTCVQFEHKHSYLIYKFIYVLGF